MGLEQYTTEELQEELVRRSNRRQPKEVKHWCDNCRYFPDTTYSKALENQDQSFSFRCRKGHLMKFRAPRDMYEAHHNHYGWYRLVCPDRDELSRDEEE